jgi:hypothetical protein
VIGLGGGIGTLHGGVLEGEDVGLDGPPLGRLFLVQERQRGIEPVSPRERLDLGLECEVNRGAALDAFDQGRRLGVCGDRR